jgi:hypothetical protein
MALWSTIGAAWLLASVAFGQASQQTGKSPKAATSAEAAATPAAGDAAAATTATPAAATPATDTAVSAEGQPAAAEAEDIDAGTYAVRLRDLEQRINELKEQIFRSKARLSLLAETVLQGVVAGAQTVIVHENKMSGSYKLVRAVYSLDGAPIFNRADEEGGLGERPVFDVYNGSIVPGEHTLTVNLEYRGHGYGIFSYLKGYRFKVRSSYSFSAPEGKAVSVRVVAYEKGGPTAPLEERPAIRYQEQITDTATLGESEKAAGTSATIGVAVGAEGGK